MHVQSLGSGSGGNATLVRADEVHVIVDAGLTWDQLLQRFERARVAPQRIDHVLLTHGHLDHARSAGRLARLARARLHLAEGMMSNASVRKAPFMVAMRQHEAFPLQREAFPLQREAFPLQREKGTGELRVRAIPIPHDASPTFAFHLEHRGRRAALVTDMGHAEPHALKSLRGVHLLLLEFNHDAELLRRGPYTQALKRRVAGPQGHLSNQEASNALRIVAGPELETLVLLHLSKANNTPELAQNAARETLQELGLGHVRILVASQDEIGPNLTV